MWTWIFRFIVNVHVHILHQLNLFVNTTYFYKCYVNLLCIVYNDAEYLNIFIFRKIWTCIFRLGSALYPDRRRIEAASLKHWRSETRHRDQPWCSEGTEWPSVFQGRALKCQESTGAQRLDNRDIAHNPEVVGSSLAPQPQNSLISLLFTFKGPGRITQFSKICSWPIPRPMWGKKCALA